MNFVLYQLVRIVKDTKTQSSPSLLVKAGTIGTVLDIEINKDGSATYLLELDNSVFGEGVTDHFDEKDLEPLEN